MEENKLTPCPFCACDNSAKLQQDIDKSGNIKYRIVCKFCGIWQQWETMKSDLTISRCKECGQINQERDFSEKEIDVIEKLSKRWNQRNCVVWSS